MANQFYASAQKDPWGRSSSNSPWGGGAPSAPWGGASAQPDQLGVKSGMRSSPWAKQLGPSGAGGGTEGVLSGPGTAEQWNKDYGKGLTETPGYGETLYGQGIGQLNPYYDFAEKEATRAINNATAARGNFNSSYAIRQIGNASANLRGQQARDMAGMAAEADRERLARYGAGFGAASGAQQFTDQRVQKAVDDALRLAEGQSSKVGGFYGNIQKGYDQATMAAIEANLKASGMSAAEIQSTMNTIMQGASLGVKAYTGGAGG